MTLEISEDERLCLIDAISSCNLPEKRFLGEVMDKLKSAT